MYPANKLVKKAVEGVILCFPDGFCQKKTKVIDPREGPASIPDIYVNRLGEISFRTDLAYNRATVVAELPELLDAMVGFADRKACKQSTGGLGVEDQRVAGVGGGLFEIGDCPPQAEILRLQGTENPTRDGIEGSIEQGDVVETKSHADP